MEDSKDIVPVEIIEDKIYLIRGQKIMLDRDLARLYGVETRTLNQAVSRNIERFPADFMLALSRDEIRNISQIVICSKIKHAKNVYAFTEQGVAMLSGVLNSSRAVQVNIAIMRAFVRLRQMLATNAELARKLEVLEQKYDSQFRVVFDAIRALMAEPETPRRPIGFTAKEQCAAYHAQQTKTR
ncbi:MAG: ORF6N domain-containing protein [Deltaproteobacteria bacterium]|nr:ORF6N domain-containing protein [Deltaproteobacteria bacterium]